MRAIAYRHAGPITAPEALVEVELETPMLGPHDLLVEVKGVSVNPVDVKVRAKSAPAADSFRILGFDAAGVVVKVGDEVSLFKVGDEVFYAGDISRPGTNAQYHAVDERIVGHKPKTLSFAQAAGMPLTSITAWELLFDSLRLEEGGGQGEALLIIGAAGGVGSILIQLAKRLTKLKVIATASRPQTQAWVEQLGADHVINHHEDMVAQLDSLGVKPRYVAALTHTATHLPAIISLIAPRGHIAVIDDPASLDANPLKLKALSLSWEMMFARPLFKTQDMIVQHQLLERVAAMLDEGLIVSTVTQELGAMSAARLIEAHQRQEREQTIGKVVLSGFEG